MQLEKIITLMGARGEGVADRQIDWLLTDSRSLCFPESTLFFAIRTARGDGHQYIGELYDRGVRAFAVESIPEGNYADACFLIVPDTLKALQRLAERRREEFDVDVIGVTGSNGKTTVKEWLYQMLSPDYTVTRSPRSYNSQVGVPLSVWGLWENTQIGLFEAAISQPGEMPALQGIIQPTIGVFTCLGRAHQENFTSMEQKCKEKLILFRDSKVLFYPSGDELVERCIHEMGFGGELIPCRSTGDALQDNKRLCAAVCRYLGMSEDVIAARLSNLEPVAMRLEVKEGRGGCTLINDSYNSDLNSLDIALDFMSRRCEQASMGRMLILSDIQQTGVPPSLFYRHVAELLESRELTHFIGVGPVISDHQHCFGGLHAECSFYLSTEELLQSHQLESLRNTIVLIKGARSFRFDHVTDLLERKVHETILEVNLSAVVENLNYYRSFLNPETKMVCMVKADAYGAGSVEIARTLQEHRVDYLAVAVADEGVTLRKAGITANIMVMNPEMTSFHTLFEYDLEPEVYSFRLLDALIHAAEKEGVTNWPVHIKLDTGMRRLGFDPDNDMEALIDRLHRQTAVIPRSVFSHFVGSDCDDFDDFSARQFRQFLHASEQLQSAFHHHILRHMCNSAGIEHFPERQMEMVRLGLGLYGINSRNNEMLSCVSTLRTTILQIHDVPAGESVGYSRRTMLTRDSRIAAIPIGYADGMDRHLGNRAAYCLVRGERAPYVGNICMDVCMIDVTDIPCEEGDEVVIFGKDLPVTTLSDITGTIPYEFLTSVSQRVKRIYYRD